RPPQERSDRQLPAPPELVGEILGRMVAAPEAPVSVRRDEADQLRGRCGDELVDKAGGERGESAQSVLLPGGDDPADGRVVLDRSARRGERDSAAGALPAALDRP